MQKRTFTLIEIVIVLIVIGILLVAVPMNLRGLENHVQLSLITQKIEDTRDAASIRMRQGRTFDSVTLALSTTGWAIQYSGGMQGDKSEVVAFDKKIDIDVDQNGGYRSMNEKELQRTMGSYGIGCTGSNVVFKFSYEGMKACYQVQLDSCILKRMQCK